MSQSRRTIGLSKMEIALIMEGLALVRKRALELEDAFKAEVVDSLADHVRVVRAKMDEKK